MNWKGAFPISSIESGLGRADILMSPVGSAKRGIVMEFKRLGENESMEEQLQAALAQIEEKRYAATLRGEGCREVLELAIVFDGRRLEIRKRLSELPEMTRNQSLNGRSIQTSLSWQPAGQISTRRFYESRATEPHLVKLRFKPTCMARAARKSDFSPSMKSIIGVPTSMKKLSIFEPCAGKPRVRFGGRGSRNTPPYSEKSLPFARVGNGLRAVPYRDEIRKYSKYCYSLRLKNPVKDQFVQLCNFSLKGIFFDLHGK